MDWMDEARRWGGLVWVAGGLIVETVWCVGYGGTVGSVTAVLAAAMTVTGVVFAVPTLRTHRGLIGRAAAVVLGLDLWGAVTDRFGVLGAPGAPGVSWGSWTVFVDYTHRLAPWLGHPQWWAVLATVTEVLLGAMLIFGLWPRWVGKATAGLLVTYLVLMVASLGYDAMLSFALPVLVGGALLASARPTGSTAAV